MPSLGIGLGLTVSRRAAPAAWSPADLPGLAPSIQVALSLSQGKLWQNAGKTVPATADGDPVRVATCPWTGQDYVAPSDSARPLLWDEGGGLWSLAFDGIDDRLVRALAAVAQPVTVGAVLVRDNTDVAFPFTGTSDYGCGAYQAAALVLFAGDSLTGAAPSGAYYQFVARFDGAASKLWENGSLVASGWAGANAAGGWSVAAAFNGSGFWAGRFAAFVPAGDVGATDRNLLSSYLTALVP